MVVALQIFLWQSVIFDEDLLMMLMIWLGVSGGLVNLSSSPFLPAYLLVSKWYQLSIHSTQDHEVKMQV